jgi:hypothetical protein
MKPGMRVIKKQQVSDRWIWLCEESLPGQGCREWATYVSVSPDEQETEHGHYFVNQRNAIADFQVRVEAYTA